MKKVALAALAAFVMSSESGAMRAADIGLQDMPVKMLVGPGCPHLAMHRQSAGVGVVELRYCKPIYDTGTLYTLADGTTMLGTDVENTIRLEKFVFRYLGDNSCELLSYSASIPQRVVSEGRRIVSYDASTNSLRFGFDSRLIEQMYDVDVPEAIKLSDPVNDSDCIAAIYTRFKELKGETLSVLAGQLVN